VKPSGPRLLSAVSFSLFFFFLTDSISLLVYYVFLLDSVLVGCIFLETCPFLSIVQSILLWVFVFLQYQLLLLTLFGSSLLLGEPGQKFIYIVYPFTEPVLGFIYFFLFFKKISIYYFFLSADFRFCLFFS